MKQYFWNVLIWLDQGINAVGSPILNILFSPHPAHRFGNPDETLSSVFGKNEHMNRRCKWVSDFLSKFDEDHCRKSIERDE